MNRLFASSFVAVALMSCPSLAVTKVQGDEPLKFDRSKNILAGCSSAACDGNDCNSCNSGGSGCSGRSSGSSCCGVGNWLDNTQISFGGDAYKSLGDSGTSGFAPLPFGLQNSFGMVSGFNTGLRLGNSKVRAQVGGSYGLYDFKGRTTTAPAKDDSLEQQTYITAGFYKRSDVCNGDRISWGIVNDSFLAQNWGWAANDVFLNQIRSITGIAINETNEVGVWGTVHTQSDNVNLGFPIGAVKTRIRSMNQANLYLRHSWGFGGSTMAYVGAVDNADIGSWQYGLLNTAPLNKNTAIYANYVYSAPGSATGLVGSSEEQWNVAVGLTYYFGNKAVNPNISGRTGMPLLPVANNGSFLITN